MKTISTHRLVRHPPWRAPGEQGTGHDTDPTVTVHCHESPSKKAKKQSAVEIASQHIAAAAEERWRLVYVKQGYSVLPLLCRSNKISQARDKTLQGGLQAIWRGAGGGDKQCGERKSRTAPALDWIIEFHATSKASMWMGRPNGSKRVRRGANTGRGELPKEHHMLWQ